MCVCGLDCIGCIGCEAVLVAVSITRTKRKLLVAFFSKIPNYTRVEKYSLWVSLKFRCNKVQAVSGEGERTAYFPDRQNQVV